MTRRTTATATADATPATPTHRGRRPPKSGDSVKLIHLGRALDALVFGQDPSDPSGGTLYLTATIDGTVTTVSAAHGLDEGCYCWADEAPAPPPSMAQVIAAREAEGLPVPVVGRACKYKIGTGPPDPARDADAVIARAVSGMYADLDIPTAQEAVCTYGRHHLGYLNGEEVDAGTGDTVTLYLASDDRAGRAGGVTAIEAEVLAIEDGGRLRVCYREAERVPGVAYGTGTHGGTWYYPDDAAVAPGPVVPAPPAPAGVRLPEPGDAVHLVEYYGRPHDLRLRTIPATIAKVRNPGDPRSPVDLNTGALDRVGGVRYVVASTWDRRRWAGTYSTNPYGEYEADREIRVGDGVTYWSTGGFAEPATVIAVDHPGPPALLTLEYQIVVPVRGSCFGDGPGDWRWSPLTPAAEPRPQLAEALA